MKTPVKRSHVAYVRSELKLKRGQKLDEFDRSMLETARLLDKMEKMFAQDEARRKRERQRRARMRKRTTRKPRR